MTPQTPTDSQRADKEPCIGFDPNCPCQDGDACHYKDAADGTKAWPLPPSARQRAYKARHRAAGRKEVRNLWAHPDDVPAIKALAAYLTRKRERTTT